MDYLFEVSWEVCNKVGGIHTVLKTKISHATELFGPGYFVFGPLLDDNPEFKETDEPEFHVISKALKEKGHNCKVGRWMAPGEPKCILVDFHNRYDTNKLLYSYWRDFGVDSYGAKWDYMEPTLFATASAEAIIAIYQALGKEQDRAIAHFHEWMMGGGILHIKKHAPEIGTVFTAHATMLGRCMAGLGRDIYQELDTLNPQEEARTYGIPAKHSMEKVAAGAADVFTTVSKVTGEEASAVLSRDPDVIVQNGMNVRALPNFAADRSLPDSHRKFIHSLAENFLQKQLPEETRFIVTSGRYEFFNKGYDVFLEALGRLNSDLVNTPEAPPIVALFLIAVGHKGVQETVLRRIAMGEQWNPDAAVGITTHRMHDEQDDPIIKACHRLNLRNAWDNKVNIIFSPAYLDGHDGIFNKSYEDILLACDLSVFPSFYEPWGYTPLESLAYCVPTVTTDVAGFGDWSRDLVEQQQRVVSIVARRGRSRDDVIGQLTEVLRGSLSLSTQERLDVAQQARDLALRADWSDFYQGYQRAYDIASERAARRFDILDTSEKPAFHTSPHATQPRYRAFTVISKPPKEIEGLYDLAYNLWWTWRPDARELFSRIDERLWVKTDCNPVQLLHQVSNKTLAERAADNDFIRLYREVMKDFQHYVEDTSSTLERSRGISQEHPVAYFSMEYGLHECLPIYSGGLGVLSGDHLKAASDLNIPLIGIGLLYRQTYFTQRINRDGYQWEEYFDLDCSRVPLRTLTDQNGNEARVSIEMPGRTLFARTWVVNVGRVKLYLLDTDVEENEPDDRQLTARLYGGDKRMRIKQEMMLGIGGLRLVRDILKIKPAVYHLNEGHCAFLFLELLRDFIQQDFSFQEARELVRAMSVFTTHTPVPAGNEVFEVEQVDHYLHEYVDRIGITWEQFLDLGRESPKSKEFSMTVFSLKLTSKANSVSKLHGKVSRDMWKNVWKGVNVEELPIFPITNGIHLQTWISGSMRNLLDQHLEINWGQNEDSDEVWTAVNRIPDEELWQVARDEKEEFVLRIKEKITEDYVRRGEDPQLIRDTVEKLSPDALTLGFARRFATYKRADLMLKDRARLSALLNDPERPVQIIVAGKAHPADSAGKELIQRIVQASREPEFRGRIVYLENYNMGIGRLLVRGVDVWLNNPLRPFEASGTSGMKVCPNGGLNFSILDGWWDEAYEPGVGWEINPRAEFKNREHQDEMDNAAMLDTLENEIVPLFYERDSKDVPTQWLRAVRASMTRLSPYFSTTRMVREYYQLSYLPTAERNFVLKERDYRDIRTVTAWKQKIASRFANVQVPKIQVRGISSDTMETGGSIEVDAFVYPGKLEPEEIEAQFVIGVREGERFTDMPRVIPMELKEKVPDSEVLHYRLSYTIEESGNYAYAVRVVPIHKLLSSTLETNLMCWG